jgi:hypothetical protein
MLFMDLADMALRDLYGFAEIGGYHKVERDYGPFVDCD